MTLRHYFLILILGITCSNCERLHEQIYSSIEGGAACFRRLNGTHQAGCSSSSKGAVGVVHMIKNLSDAQWVVTDSTAGPYIAVVNTALFSDVIEVFMPQPKDVVGILLFNNDTDSASAFSQDSQCPNKFSSEPNSKCPADDGFVWNEKGTGLLNRDIPFPIFYLPESKIAEINTIEECYKKFNLDKNNQKGRALCSIELIAFMYAAVSSEICLRRSATSALLSSTKVCDPLKDQNVYYSLFPRKKSNTTQENITLVTARIDSASLFDGISPGAASSVVGMVTLLSAAATLSQLVPVADAKLYSQNIMFTLFNGEVFDYIGSQRVAYDIARGEWPPNAPLKATDIRLHVEVGQIGGSLMANNGTTAWPLTAFAPYNIIVSEIDEFISDMSKAPNIAVTAKYDTNIPPSSLHSFRRILKNYTTSDEPQLPEVLITDHDKAFTNMFYNSALDEYQKIGFVYHNISVGSDGRFLSTEELLLNGIMKETEMQVKIARLATALAYTLYKKVTGKVYDGNFTSSAHLVDEVLYCFLRSQSCRALSAADYAGNSVEGADRPVPLYVSVAAWPATASIFAGHMLALLAGNVVPAANKTACDDRQDDGFSYYWLKGWNHTGQCYQSTMNFTQAMSPAFLIPKYNMSSGEYSTWTESVWSTMSARVFVRGSGASAAVAGAVGALSTLVALACTLWLRKHSRMLFTDHQPTDDATSGILRTVNC